MPITSAGSGSTWKCRKITDKKYGQPEHGVPDIRQSAAGTAGHGRRFANTDVTLKTGLQGNVSLQPRFRVFMKK